MAARKRRLSERTFGLRRARAEGAGTLNRRAASFLVIRHFSGGFYTHAAELVGAPRHADQQPTQPVAQPRRRNAIQWFTYLQFKG